MTSAMSLYDHDHAVVLCDDFMNTPRDEELGFVQYMVCGETSVAIARSEEHVIKDDLYEAVVDVSGIGG